MTKAKIDPKKIVAQVRSMYGKDAKAASIIATGASIKRPTAPEDFLLAPEGHPWKDLTGLLGLPWNKIVQVAGKPDSGKSTIGAEFMAAAQKSGTYVILWDSEDKFDANRFQSQFGGSPDDLLLITTNEILKGGAAVVRFINAIKEADKNAKILVVWDSVGGSQSRAHAERELDNEKHAQPGQDAKENASVMKTLVGLINKYPDSIAVYLVNQVYSKIGFMQHGDAASGGQKIEFHSSLIIFLKRIKTIVKTVNKKKVKTGIITRATITKNHLSQNATSVYSMDFTITAAGTRMSDQEVSEDEEENDE